jgi:DnaJ-class molecular chaperone
MKDLYKTLGVAESADEAAIKKAYRKLAKEYHPDVTGNDKKKTERFKEINEAYARAGRRQKRKEYDRLKHAPVRPDGMPEGSIPTRSPAPSAARARRRGRRVQRRLRRRDIFASLFGGRRRPADRPVGRPRAATPEPWRGRPRPAAGQLRGGGAGSEAHRPDRPAATVEISVPPGVESGGRLRIPGKGAAAPLQSGVAGRSLPGAGVDPIRTCGAPATTSSWTCQ